MNRRAAAPPPRTKSLDRFLYNVCFVTVCWYLLKIHIGMLFGNGYIESILLSNISLCVCVCLLIIGIFLFVRIKHYMRYIFVYNTFYEHNIFLCICCIYLLVMCTGTCTAYFIYWVNTMDFCVYSVLCIYTINWLLSRAHPTLFCDTYVQKNIHLLNICSRRDWAGVLFIVCSETNKLFVDWNRRIILLGFIIIKLNIIYTYIYICIEQNICGLRDELVYHRMNVVCFVRDIIFWCNNNISRCIRNWNIYISL